MSRRRGQPMYAPLSQQPGNEQPEQLGDTSLPKRAWPLKVHLLLFGLALILPLMTLAGYFLIKINNANRAELEQRMVQVAAGLTADIEREIHRRVTILQTLATSPALERGDFRAFHSYASAVLREDKAGIFLIDPASFQQLLNTYVPFGTELPTYGSPETAQRALETKRWQVSNFFIGRVSKKPALDIALPVLKGGKVRYLLVMGLEPYMFERIVEAQKLPGDWVVDVADRDGTIIVRSKDQDKYVGTKLPAGFFEQHAGTVTSGVGLQGVPVLRAASTSPLSGWRIAINLPAVAAKEPIRQGLLYLGLWSVVALLMTALIASAFSRMMTRPIAAAADAAADLAHRRAIAPLDSRVSEANRLIGAIKRAAQDLSSAEEIRLATEERRRSAYQRLEQERSQTAALLRQREAIFAAMPNGMLVIGDDGCIHLLNEQLARQFGYRQDELRGRKIETLVPERFRGNHASLRETFMRAPSPRPMGAGRDLFGLRKDGSEFPIEIGLNPLTVDGREMVLAVVIDIAERKRAEAAAAESAARQAALYNLADRLHRADTMSAIYDAALDTMHDALHCDRASILLRDEAGVVRFVAWRGLSFEYRLAVDGHSPWTGNEPDPQPIYIPDMAAAEIEEGLKKIVAGEGIRALAFIPLVSAGRLLGKFMTYYNEPHVFSEDERAIGLTIARQLALSIERKQAADSVRESERRLELALTAGRMGAWEWDIRRNRVFWSPGLELIHGLEPKTFGGTFDDFKSDIHPGDKAQVLAEIQDAVRERRDYHVVYRIQRRDGLRWLEAFGRLTLGWDGEPQSMAGVCIDITERKRAEETEKLLTAELEHRTKNLFAIVQALATRTLRGTPILDEARKAFVGRLQALARSNVRQAASVWSGARLDEVIKSELDHFADRITIDGPEIALAPQAAQNFALAIHELATNAAKYGSLSDPGGEVTIGWTVANDGGGGALQFRWQERGGPPVTLPKRKGFGTSLLESTLGKGHIDYNPGGMTYEVELPLANITSRNNAAEPAATG